MNPLRQFKQVVSDLKNKVRSKFQKTIGIKTIGEYKIEIARMLEDLEIISDFDTIDELIDQMGIQGVAQEYININKYYKEYYQYIIKEVKKASNTSNEFKNQVRAAEAKWEKTYKEIIQYLYDRKYEMMYGKNEDVQIYHANSFADEELPWLRKEDLNENYNNDFYLVEGFNEGLKGLSLGALGGVGAAIVASSLSAAFHLHPRMITGITTALGAIAGHFIQKHFFIDFTNYVKVKRYITHYPESFEMICDIMSKNAVKFQQKDPVKYKKILMNLKRLQQNPPEIYRNYLDDEIEQDDAAFDADTFVVRDADDNIIRTAGAVGSYNNYSSNSSPSLRRNRSRERLASRSRNYDIDRNSYQSDKDLEIQARDLLGDI